MPYSEEEVEQALLRLYELGLINMEYNENLEATFSIVDKERMQKFIDTMKEFRRDV